MNKKLREKFDSWDLKSFFLTFAFLVIGLFVFFYFSNIRDRYRTEDEEEFKGLAIAEIISIEKMDRMTQNRVNGTKIYTDSYKVHYRFETNGLVFESTDIVPVTGKNKKLLTEILKTKDRNTCKVKFDTDDPNKSLLVKSE